MSRLHEEKQEDPLEKRRNNMNEIGDWTTDESSSDGASDSLEEEVVTHMSAQNVIKS